MFLVDFIIKLKLFIRNICGVKLLICNCIL